MSLYQIFGGRLLPAEGARISQKSTVYRFRRCLPSLPERHGSTCQRGCQPNLLYVYTSIMDGFDNLRPPAVPAETFVKYICFTNVPNLPRVTPWEYRSAAILDMRQVALKMGRW